MRTLTQPALMSISAFCAWASLGRTKVYEEIGAGRLKTIKVGSRRLVALADANAWLEQLANA